MLPDTRDPSVTTLKRIQNYLGQYLGRNSYANLKKEILTIQSKAAGLLHEFEDEDTANPKQYDEIQMFCELEQEVDNAQLQSVLCDDETDISEAEMSVKLLSSLHNDYSEGLSYTITQAHRRIQRIKEDAVSAGANVGQIAGLLEPQIQLLQNVLTRHSLNEMLLVIDQQVLELTSRVKDIDSQIREAQVDGEMALAEGLCYNKIDMLEHKTNLLQRKFKLINEEQAWLEKTIRDIESRRSAVEFKFQGMVPKYKHKFDVFNREISRLEEAMAAKKSQEVNAFSHQNEVFKESEAWLLQNQDEQDMILNKMVRLEADLRALAEDRMMELQRRWDLKESWNDRLGSMLAYKSFFSARKSTLTTSKTASAVAQSCCAQMDELSRSLKEMARSALIHHQQEVVGALEDRTCLEYFEAFRDIYLSMGDLAYKKRKFRDEISQACERSRIQMEISKETFNPVAKNHLADVNATRQMLDAVSQEIDSLQKKMQAVLNDVKPVEEKMQSKGLTPKVHPTQELNDSYTLRSQKMMFYRELAATDAEQRKRRHPTLQLRSADNHLSHSCDLTISAIDLTENVTASAAGPPLFLPIKEAFPER